MKRLMGALLLCLCLTGCAATETADADALRERYRAPCAYTATATVRVLREDDTVVRCTLRVDCSGADTRVTVLDPPELAGIGAELSADALTLTYDGLVLDASGALESVSAVNCVPLCLRAAAEGYLVEQGESADGTLRLRVESECSGETLCYTLNFDDRGQIIYAEIEKNGKIVIDMEFTSFAFGDIMPSGAFPDALH